MIALQPRLVPLRVHESGVHGLVQKLLVEQDAVDMLEQDAVDVLHCGSTQKERLFRPEHGDECSVDHRASHIICACHRSRNKKNAKMVSDREILTDFCLEFRGLLQGPGYLLSELWVKIKNPWLAIILSPRYCLPSDSTVSF